MQIEFRRAVPGVRRLRIAFLVRALSVGGAERQLTLLATGLAARGHQVAVLVFYRGGPLEDEMVSAGVTIVDLAKSGRWDVAGFGARLWRYLRSERPEVVYSFLPSANVLIATMGFLLPRLRFVMGVRSTEMNYDKRDGLGRIAAAIEGRLATRAAALICNSYSARALQVQRGVDPGKIAVIRNILDASRYQRDEGARRAQRAAWGLARGHVAIGIVGRLDPMKGHLVFFDAVDRLVQRRTDIRVFVVGDGPEAFRAGLMSAVQRHIGPGTVSWMPAQRDLVPIYSGLDIVCSASSYGEGFSNVLCEAMACGCTCVATDVGDSKDILGAFGHLVAAGDAAAMAEALSAAADGAGSVDAQHMRQHILALCGCDTVLELTAAVLARAASGLPTMRSVSMSIGKGPR